MFVKDELFHLFGPKMLLLDIAILTLMSMCFIERKNFIMCFTECCFDLKRINILHLTTTLLVNIKHLGPRKFKVCGESTFNYFG